MQIIIVFICDGNVVCEMLLAAVVVITAHTDEPKKRPN